MMNEVCRHPHERETFDELLAQVRQAHARLGRAVVDTPEIDRPCSQGPSGEVMSGRQRLEALARPWSEHGRELQEAEAPSPSACAVARQRASATRSAAPGGAGRGPPRRARAYRLALLICPRTWPPGKVLVCTFT